MKTLDWVLGRLGESSTWRGLIAMAGAIGLVIQPQLQEYIISFALGAIGIINIIRKEQA